MKITRMPASRHVAVGISLVGLVVLACWWWAHPTFNLWETNDGTWHLLRSYVFADLLQRGVWFPRWRRTSTWAMGTPSSTMSRRSPTTWQRWGTSSDWTAMGGCRPSASSRSWRGGQASLAWPAPSGRPARRASWRPRPMSWPHMPFCPLSTARAMCRKRWRSVYCPGCSGRPGTYGTRRSGPAPCCSPS